MRQLFQRARQSAYRRRLACSAFGLLALGACAQPLELVSLKEGALHADIDYLDSAISNNVGDTIEVHAIGKDAWPNVTFNAIGKPWNLKGYATVKADFTNLGSAPLQVGIRLDSAKAAETETPQHAQGFELLDPAETRTISVRLVSDGWVFTNAVELVGMRRAPGAELVDVANIGRIQVFAGHVKQPCLFAVSNLRAEGSVGQRSAEGFLPFIDTYGQTKHREWEGKIRAHADFAVLRTAEEQDLAQHPGRSDLGTYRGWTGGEKREATGWFRVEKVDGQWWLVDPEGYLFWSHGATCIDPNFGYTGIQGREDYFEGLPADDKPLGQFYSQSSWAPHGFYADKVPFKIFQFYKANLFRKYGENWKADFSDSVHKRIKSWDMNTIANWADREVYRGQRTPYVANFFIRGNRQLEGSHGYWGKFHDVFDPSFRASIQRTLKQRKREAKDPWCIGFFVDNELSWGYDGMSLAIDTLASPADQPAKIEFIGDLQAKYGDIATLNLAWGTRHASWEALLASREPPEAVRAGEDLRVFYRKTCNTYFGTIRDELESAAPNHLYLGCRFAWVNDAVAVAASEYCDVVSYNKYNHSVRGLRLPHQIDKPLMIGEYHFGATDRGHFHPGLREGADQLERAEKFKAYFTSALDNPQMVGVHWFQWVDEHAAGRADEENYNVGLVDICDTPYPEMVSAMREVGATMYESRTGKGN
ncbi:hypothetical protein PDESU_01331 [Pontiella desulfatans]|uniref:Glycoside hydrolase family 42 N-terminal domain-containing protein n=1 Tax=Pontiella desulfatans TaxID=2750659 RepID=A0A6C2TYS9_PONDE|nr:beta-agarase [Pontiella desulfatans]VGO12777.1 hypothetical protein PDESU_01331 [Pontiella desulfatans]